MSVVVTYIRDLMFGSKIDAVFARLGVNTRKIRASSELVSIASECEIQAAVLNLAIPGDDVFIAAELLIKRNMPIWGYYPHVETAVRDRALSLGISEVHPRGAILSVIESAFASQRLTS